MLPAQRLYPHIIHAQQIFVYQAVMLAPERRSMAYGTGYARDVTATQRVRNPLLWHALHTTRLSSSGRLSCNRHAQS